MKQNNKELFLILNRLAYHVGCICVWQGIWNIIAELIPASDILGNICIAMFGIALLGYAGEFVDPLKDAREKMNLDYGED
jgi:hypothetical protein